MNPPSESSETGAPPNVPIAAASPDLEEAGGSNSPTPAPPAVLTFSNSFELGETVETSVNVHAHVRFIPYLVQGASWHYLEDPNAKPYFIMEIFRNKGGHRYKRWIYDTSDASNVVIEITIDDQPMPPVVIEEGRQGRMSDRDIRSLGHTLAAKYGQNLPSARRIA